MTYNSKSRTSENTVENVVLNGILNVLNKEEAWVGTMTDLNTTLVKVVGRKQSTMLPGSPSALRMVVNRVVNKLRNRKVSVKFARTTDHNRTRYVKFSR